MELWQPQTLSLMRIILLGRESSKLKLWPPSLVTIFPEDIVLTYDTKCDQCMDQSFHGPRLSFWRINFDYDVRRLVATFAKSDAGSSTIIFI